MTISRELAEFATGYGAGSFAVGRNRIINGDMRIDQRNDGAAVNLTGSGIYFIDRYSSRNNGGTWGPGVLSAQRSSTAPAGFENSLALTVSTADSSITSGDAYIVSQLIEGYNISDFGYGTADAKTVTVSFWVRASLTGTFAGSFTNGSNTRSYPFNYAISSADTWEYKTITIPGDTTGTWNTDKAVGIRLNFDMGTGSDRQGTLNTWQATGACSTPSAVQLIGTLNATWYITGVQLEAGSVATSFERRMYGQELALCQRYYTRLGGNTGNGYQGFCTAAGYGTSNARGVIHLPVSMRTAPTFAHAGNFEFLPGPGGTSVSSIGLADAGGNPNVALNFTSTSAFLVSAGGYEIRAANDSSAHFSFTAEL
jgi:hypothetical protein